MANATPWRLEISPEQRKHLERGRPEFGGLHVYEIAVELQAEPASVKRELARSQRYPVRGHDGYFLREHAGQFIREVRAGRIAVEPAIEPAPPAPPSAPYVHPDDDGRGFYDIAEVAKLFNVDITESDWPIQELIRRGRLPAVLTVHHRLLAKFPKGLIDDFLEGKRLLAERREAEQRAADAAEPVAPKRRAK